MGINIWILVVVAVLFYVPYVKRVVYFPYLYFHEFGHSFMALLLRVRRKRMTFKLHEGSGQVIVSWNTRNKIKVLLIGAIGYIFPVIVVYAGIWLHQHEKSHWFVIGLMLSLVYGVLNTGSFIGWVLISTGAMLGGWLYFTGQWTQDLAQVITVVTVTVLVMGCLDTIVTLVGNYQRVQREDNGDSSLLSKEIGLPVGVWMGFFVLINVYSGVLLYWMWRGTELAGIWN